MEGLNALFTDHWKVQTWSDLMLFSSADVDMALTAADNSTNIPTAWTTPLIVRKLGYIIDYVAAVGASLTTDVSMDEIVDRVNAASKSHLACTTTTSTTPVDSYLLDDVLIPTLEKFHGQDLDYFVWRESTITILGMAGLVRFLDDPIMVQRHPDIAECVFYTLRRAVVHSSSQAHLIAQTMRNNKQLDPTLLWNGFEEYYNTDRNRANVVFMDTMCLLNLRLTPDTEATKFISDFRNCLQRLRKNKARLVEDDATLCVVLLRAIQDDTFEVVRDKIVTNPTSTVETFLTNLRERDIVLKMKDNASNMQGDRHNNNTRYKKRKLSANNQSRHRSRGGCLNGYKNGNQKARKIPRFS